MLVNSYKTARR